MPDTGAFTLIFMETSLVLLTGQLKRLVHMVLFDTYNLDKRTTKFEELFRDVFNGGGGTDDKNLLVQVYSIARLPCYNKDDMFSTRVRGLVVRCCTPGMVESVVDLFVVVHGGDSGVEFNFAIVTLVTHFYYLRPWHEAATVKSY
ncbi:hypothetical protein ACJX0J_018466 [Zea mays]